MNEVKHTPASSVTLDEMGLEAARKAQQKALEDCGDVMCPSDHIEAAIRAYLDALTSKEPSVAIPEFIRGWTAPFCYTMDGIKDAKGCWIASATNPKLGHQLVELMNYAAALGEASLPARTEAVATVHVFESAACNGRKVGSIRNWDAFIRSLPVGDHPLFAHPLPTRTEAGVMEAARAVIASWDDRMHGEREALKTLEIGDHQYWSPSASMVDSAAISALRAALAASSPERAAK